MTAQNRLKPVLGMAGYLLSIIAMYFLLLYTGVILHPVVLCILSCGVGLLFVFLRRFEADCGIKRKGMIYALALLFAALFIIGRRVVSSPRIHIDPVGKTEVVMILLSSALFYQVLCCLFVLISLLNRLFSSPWYADQIEKRMKPFLSAKHFQLIVFLGLFIGWGIFWLTYFPGTGFTDTLWIWKNYVYSSAQHTITWNAIFYGIMSLGKLIGGSWFWGVALYSFVQLVFCAWVVSYVLKWLAGKKLPSVLVMAVFLFFLFSRIIANVGVQAIKDTIFGYSMLLLIPLLFDCAETKGKSLLVPKNLAMFAIASALTILIRNNGIFVMAPVAVVMIIVCRKEWKRLVLICLSVVIIPFAADRIIMKTVVKRDKIAVESLAIPLQQMAAVVAHDGNMSELDRKTMNRIMPLEEIKARYSPICVDTLKWGEGAQYLNKNWIAKHKDKFFRTWFSLLKKNPKIYVEAYLLQTLSYWKWGEPSYDQSLFYSFPQNPDIPLEVKQKQIFPDIIQNSLDQYYQVKLIPSGGTMIWLILMMVCYLFCTRQSQKILCFLPVILIWGTLMFSAPIAHGFRYVLPLYLAIPFLLSSLFIRPAQQTEKEVPGAESSVQ